MARKGGTPENLIPIKKGERLNPNGRPRKLITDVIKQLEELGIKPATKPDIQDIYMRLINVDIPELEKIVKDTTQPALVRIVGKNVLSGKGFDIIEKMLDRSIGMAMNSIDLNANVQSTNLTREEFLANLNKFDNEV